MRTKKTNLSEGNPESTEVTMNKKMNIALRMLQYKALTCYEITQKLREKGCTPDEVSIIRKQLEDWGYLNERVLVEQYIQARVSRYSRLRIHYALMQRGVSELMVTQGLEAFYSEEKELENCRKEAMKFWQAEKKDLGKSAGEKNTDRDAVQTSAAKEQEQTFRNIMAKIARKLNQRGYPSSCIRAATQQIQKEHQLDIISNLY